MRPEQGCAEGPSTVESLGRQLRSTIPLLRINSVSVYDSSGSVLWLSEGALGPDEHTLVQEALGLLSNEPDRESWEQKFEDNRAAVIAPLRSNARGLTGIVLVLTEIHYDSDTVKTRILSPAVFELLGNLAEIIPAPGEDLEKPGAPEDPISLASESVPAATQGASSEPAAPLVLRLEEPAVKALEDTDRTQVLPNLATLLQDSSDLPLYVQPFVKLRAGGRTRRFEVLPRGTPQQNRNPGALDLLALDRLLAWLEQNRQAWTHERTTFSLSLSLISLENPTFIRQLLKKLAERRISPATLGFEIAEPLCLQHRALIERFIGECDKLGCFVILDGFTFDAAVLPLLRHKSVQLVKVQPKLTTAVLQDKLSQAIVLAIVNAVKVLGIHCAVKKVESQTALRWLKDVGCDFAQGDMMMRAKPIDTLKEPARAPEARAARA